MPDKISLEVFMQTICKVADKDSIYQCYSKVQLLKKKKGCKIQLTLEKNTEYCIRTVSFCKLPNTESILKWRIFHSEENKNKDQPHVPVTKFLFGNYEK